MDALNTLSSSASQSAQAIQAGQANTAAPANQAQGVPSGLPPANLARAASANTVDAELVSSQWGIDSAAVGGLYGGGADSGGLFAGTSLLPMLTNLSHATAEQALALIGVQTPRPSGSAGATSGTTAPGSTASATAQNQAALAPAASSGSSAGTLVDPLWGRSG
jgi:hypothetical protein